MKKEVTIGLMTALLALPTLALADNNRGGLGVEMGADASLEHRAQIGDIDADGKLDVKIQQIKGEYRDSDDDNDSVADKREDADRRQDSKQKENRGEKSTTTDDEGKGWGRGGIRSFLSFFFGLPASTTVGDLRNELTAKGSASAAASTSKSQGLGFWARIFGAFKFGN